MKLAVFVSEIPNGILKNSAADCFLIKFRPEKFRLVPIKKRSKMK